MRSNRFFNSILILFAGVILSDAAASQTVNLQMQSDYPVGNSIATPRFAVGDVNNDGLPDLVTLNQNNLSTIGPLSVFLNNNAGGFGAPINITDSSLNPFDAVIGDFNNDGRADLAIASGGLTTGLHIRLGNGTGNFPTGNFIGTERTSPVIASADFNADGNLDVATCNSLNELRVLPGTGTGGFGAAAVFTTAATCQDVVVADFNVDGRPDLAVAMRLAPSDRGVQIFVNNGTSFNAPLNVTAAAATELVVADFNRDCIPDLAAAQFASSVTGTPIFILLGNGAGGFTSTTLTVNNFPRYMTVGDFNRDKKVDLAIRRNVNTAGANNLTILPGNGSGGFGTAFDTSIAVATSSTEMQLATMDANRDGRDDLIIGRLGGFLLYHGNSALFTRTESDFDGDLRSDRSVFRPAEGNWYIDRSTKGPYAIHWGAQGDKPVPADYDGDGKADVAVWRANGFGDPDYSFYFVLRSSDGTVQQEQFGRSGDNSGLVGDWDGDGRADVAVYRGGGAAGDQSFFFYRPSASPGIDFRVVPYGLNGDEAVRGDFDGDGKLDPAVFRPSNGVWYYAQSSNGQTLTGVWGVASDRRVASDYDGDGRTDLAVFRPSNNIWYILASATGTPIYRQWGTSGDVIVPADFNGDGKSEPTVYRPSDQRWYTPPCVNFAQYAVRYGSSGDVVVPGSLYQ